MCFGSKKDADDAPPPRPAARASIDKPTSANGRKGSRGNDKSQHQEPIFSSHSGPSSQSNSAQPTYAAPPQQQQQQQQPIYAPTLSEAPPPSGPPPPTTGEHPPGYAEAPPTYSDPQHDWRAAVPDTSLFPPPPAIFSGYERSPTSNAPEEEANAGEDWCAQYPLCQPMILDAAARGALDTGNIRLMEPAGFSGKLNWLGLGHWGVTTPRNTPDRCIISYPPLYVVNEHDPHRTQQARTVYYELRLRDESANASVGMGFSALPYPSFRMPGWHRGSLAVHGDDGHKYINDRWGGKQFTAAFKNGDTYGIGMTFKPTPGGQIGTKPLVDIFFTKNGQLAGGWNLHEETDAEEDLPVTGLEGLHDVCCSVGTYDGVAFEVVFDRNKWLYKDMM